MAKVKRWTPAVERAAYLAEVEALAVELRPRFLSGELRGWADPYDGERFAAEQAQGRTWEPPLWKLEKIARARLAPTQAAAFRALSLSRRSRWDTGCKGARYLAGDAVALDLLAVARRRGWLQPAPKWTAPDLQPPTPERLAELERVALENLTKARTQARAAVGELAPVLKAKDAPAAALRDGAGKAYLALGYLQTMASAAADRTAVRVGVG